MLCGRRRGGTPRPTWSAPPNEVSDLVYIKKHLRSFAREMIRAMLLHHPVYPVKKSVYTDLPLRSLCLLWLKSATHATSGLGDPVCPVHPVQRNLCETSRALHLCVEIVRTAGGTGDLADFVCVRLVPADNWKRIAPNFADTRR